MEGIGKEYHRHWHTFVIRGVQRDGRKVIITARCECGKEKIRKYILPANYELDFSQSQNQKPVSQNSASPVPVSPVQNGRVGVIPTGVIYRDWAKILPILDQAYELRIPVLIIGPKGSGKTEAVRKWCEMRKKKLFAVNFSLRTKETHVLGQQVLENGTVKFVPGILPLSMMEGGVFYADELSYAEPDVLVVLDSALDVRREIVLKEAGEPVRIQAHPDWWCVATTNPITHAGSKELPPQILSRFPVRIYLDYPSPLQELAIIKEHLGLKEFSEELETKINTIIRVANELRRAEREGELPYAPSLRETITASRLVKEGMSLKDALEATMINQYGQWDRITMDKVANLVKSVTGG